jgi:predicted MPP superfamily phosphohydrolase
MANGVDGAARNEQQRLSRRGCLKLGGLTAAGIAVAAGSAWYARTVAPRGLEVTTFDLHLPSLRPELDGVRIAHLSDLHASDIVGPEWIRHSVDEVNTFEPDLACLTGDFVYRSAEWARGCAAELSRLKAPAGAFAVLGNHDIWNGATKIASALMQAGIRVLRNEGEGVRVREAMLWIIGLEDTGLSCLGDLQAWDRMRQAWAAASKVAAEVLAGVPPTEPSLILVHNPDFMEMMVD